MVQKYYKLAVYAGNATVPSSQQTSGRQLQGVRRSTSQYLEVGVFERAPSPMDKIIRINPLFTPKKEQKFTLTFILIQAIIFGLILVFGIVIMLATIHENMKAGKCVKNTRCMHRDDLLTV